MQKKFLTNLALIIFLNLIIKPFWFFGIDVGVQNAVGAEDYGFYFAILNFSFLFNILLDLGITNFNNRNIAQNNQLLNKHFSGIILLKFLLLILYFIITIVVGFLIGYDTSQFKILIWVGFNQFLLSFLLYLRSNISGLLLFRTDSFLSILDRSLMILFISLLLWGNIIDADFQIEWFVYAQTAAYLVSVIIAFTIVVLKSKFRKLNWNKAFFLMILRKSFPFALLILLMTAYNRVDTVIIERLLPERSGDQQAGIYAMGFRILDASNQIAYLFAVLLLPLFSYLVKQKENVFPIVKISFTLLLTISLIASLGAFFYQEEIMRLLYRINTGETESMYTQRIDEAAHIFSLLMFEFIAISSTYVFGTLLTANGNLKLLNFVAAGGMLLSLALNLILVPRFWALGSAYASLTAQGITALIQIVLGIKIFKLPFKAGFYIRLLALLGGIITINFTVPLIKLDWKLSFMIMIALSLIWAFILKFLNIKEFIHIIVKSEQVK